MRSGIPQIAVSSIPAEKQHQADRGFSMRVAFDDSEFILSTLSRTIAQRFSMGDRSGLLPDHTPFAQMSGKLSWHHRLVSAAVWTRTSSCWKRSCDMSGRSLTAALLEACSPFDALSPTLPSPSALPPRRSPTWQFCRRARRGRGQYVTRGKGLSILEVWTLQFGPLSPVTVWPYISTRLSKPLNVLYLRAFSLMRESVLIRTY